MAITFPRTFPTELKVRASKFELEGNTEIFEAPINKVQQALSRPGEQWRGVFTLTASNGAAARTLKAWIVSLGGRLGTFRAGDPDAAMPLGVADSGTSTPIVKGAGQTGISLLTDGWKINTNNLLLPGDPWQNSDQLKMTTEPVDSDGSGNATLVFRSPLHKSPVDNSAIIFESPTGVFRLDDDTGSWESNATGVHRFSFAFSEVLETQ